MKEIPLGLKSALETGNCVLFVGAGIGKHFLDQNGKPAPTGEKLARELAEHFSIEVDGKYELSIIAEYVELNKGRKELETFLKKRFSNLEPDDTVKWLFSLHWKAIYTTNYDNCIQRTYDIIENPQQIPITISITPEVVPYDLRIHVPIFHLHGTLYGTRNPKIIITIADYSKYADGRKSLFGVLKHDFLTSTILYVGYSGSDPNWRTLLEEAKDEFKPNELPPSYRIVLETNTMEKEILRAKKIETIECSIEDFVVATMSVLDDIKIDYDQLSQIRSTIPDDLKGEFDKNPAGVARLDNSWTYVNQAEFNQKPNTHSFLRGDLSNWALIGGNQHFERDIEDSVYDKLIDYATTPSIKSPQVILVFGPAGYGTSTVLMSLATKLIKGKAGAVFSLKPAQKLFEGDVEFVTSIFPDRPFFFIDNAVSSLGALITIIQRLKDLGRPAMFVLGARLNEWKQSRKKLRGKEFLIEPLSDNEINLLLDCLTRHGDLCKLEHLDRNMQFNAIKKHYEKELLVAMREATEGKSFNAILEDEYRNIESDDARKLYLTVCCLYQLGIYIRDELLADLLGINIVQIYELSRDKLPGVVNFTCINENTGRNIARARHRTIAKIVWERCSTRPEQEELLQKTISSLNLNYKYDVDAFEELYQNDRLVENLRSLDDKIKFFEKACEKDPDSPYVRQHYARMFAREDKSELALMQIDKALQLEPNALMLLHTKGVILMHIAMQQRDRDLARKQLANSEDCFYKGLNVFPKDEYCYQGLAQLYIRWATNPATPEDEMVDYLSKAEEIIERGLKTIRNRERLWIESSNIQRFCGDQPGRIRALKQAVKDNPGGIYSRYVLARTFRSNGQYEEAIEVLSPIIQSYPDEYRSYVENALSMVYLRKPYSEIIAILSLSGTFGLSDPRFISTLGGLYFLNREFTESENIFAESIKREFNYHELTKVHFTPPAPNSLDNYILLKGKVITAKSGLVVIETTDYPNFICPRSKFNRIDMFLGLRLSFNIAFSAKSPIAINPQKIK